MNATQTAIPEIKGTAGRPTLRDKSMQAPESAQVATDAAVVLCDLIEALQGRIDDLEARLGSQPDTPRPTRHLVEPCPLCSRSDRREDWRRHDYDL
ncbi:MAG TPA: hypothetical protein VF297_05390 [Pyrinomonadaceae bacterium]